MASKSPVSAASQPKGSSAPETPGAVPTSPRTVPFPSPQTFDFLPPLHALLLRLLASAQVTNQAAATASTAAPEAASDASGAGPSAAAASSGPSTTPSQAQQQQSQQAQPQQQPDAKASQQPAPSTTVPTTSSATADTSLLGPNAPPPLDVKDLPTAASAIKIRIQKARAVIEGLPDVSRTVEEQQQEIDELQDRIGRLRAVIAEFGRRAGMDQTDKMETGP